jgi:hypothetical protein
MRVILRLGLFHFVSTTGEGFAQLSQARLPMPALAIDGEKATR